MWNSVMTGSFSFIGCVVSFAQLECINTLFSHWQIDLRIFFLLLHWRIGKYGRFCSFRLLIPCARHKSGVIITSKLFIKISFGLHTFKSIGQLGKSSLKVFSCNTCHGFCQQFSNGPSLEICWKKSNNGFSSA